MIALEAGQSNTILSAAAAVGTGTVYAVPQCPVGGLFGSGKEFTWQVNTNAVGAIQVDLEGSLDNSNWFVLDSYAGVGDTLRSVASKPVNFIRANVITLPDLTIQSVIVSF